MAGHRDSKADSKPSPKRYDADQEFRRQVEIEKVRRRQQARQRGIDEHFREAQERGDFDDLPGKGKPLKWDSGADGEWWLANHMLKNAGHVPAWIEDAQHIEKEKARLEGLLTRLAERFREGERNNERSDAGQESTERDRGALLRELQRGLAAWRDAAAKLNRVIERYNLEVPLPEKQTRRIPIDDKIEMLAIRLGLNDHLRMLLGDKD